MLGVQKGAIVIIVNIPFSDLQGEYDALPEQAFYMVGPIEEVVQKAEKLAEEHS